MAEQARSWISIVLNAGSILTSSGRMFHVSFDIKPRVNAVRTEEIELLRIDQSFFAILLRMFFHTGGNIHIHVGGGSSESREWPKAVSLESEVEGVISSLLRLPKAHTYPLVIWLEPRKLREFQVIGEDDFRSAAENLDELDAMIASGFARMFLDEEWGDLIADERDRSSISEWIELAAARSSAVATKHGK